MTRSVVGGALAALLTTACEQVSGADFDEKTLATPIIPVEPYQLSTGACTAPVGDPLPPVDGCVALNDDGATDDGCVTGPGLLASRYTNVDAIRVRRIEVLTGLVAGQAGMSLWSDDPVANAPAVLLGTASYSQTAAIEWQGADFVPAVPLEPRTTYWIGWDRVDGSDCSQTFVEIGMVPPSGLLPTAYRGSPDQGLSWLDVFCGYPKFRLYCAD